MSENTNIEWCTHTFNAWWGCTKVHTGCANCYAEATDARWGGDHWGKDASRRMILGEWGKPAKWNREAEAAGTPATVFASSMCDVFEAFDGAVVNQQDQRLYIERPGRLINAEIARNLITTTDTGDPVTLAYLRSKLWPIIESTPWLRWLLLTKRPENIMGMVPESWREAWPAHVWTGTSPVNQKTADECIPHLLKVPGKHFLSVEPMVGPVNVSGWPDEGIDYTPDSFDASAWPGWVSSRVLLELRRFWTDGHRSIKNYWENAKSNRAPAFGAIMGMTARQWLCAADSPEAVVRGRFVHAWNNMGRLISDRGEYVVAFGRGRDYSHRFLGADGQYRHKINWVICGGESGAGKTIRPFDLAWARSLRDQCRAAGVPFFMKQLGAKPCNLPLHIGDGSGRGGLLNKKGGDPAEWPEDLRVRQFPDWRVDQ